MSQHARPEPPHVRPELPHVRPEPTHAQPAASHDRSLRSGLEGVVAAQTRVSHVDGHAGVLIVAGFPIAALADKAVAEETIHLLWKDVLPDARQLTHLRGALATRRALPGPTLELLRGAAARNATPMDALRMAAATLDLPSDPAAPPPADAAGYEELALRLVAQLPTAVAAYARLRDGKAPVSPDPELPHAANYLYMLTGERPSPARVRALETYLNTVSDNGLNASTFTARVIMATRSDLVSAVTGAIGALKGPLHGGAPGPVLDMLDEIREAGDVDAILRRKIEAGERLMGFGHRVFKVRDPRAPVLSAAAAKLYGDERDASLYRLACAVEERAVALLEQHKPGRNLQTNVEFFTALVLNGVGLARDLFTPTFAVGRVAGWIAHCFEQRAVDRLIRPDAIYVGATDRQWVPLEKR